jgi:hypothetical protein
LAGGLLDQVFAHGLAERLGPHEPFSSALAHAQPLPPPLPQPLSQPLSLPLPQSQTHAQLQPQPQAQARAQAYAQPQPQAPSPSPSPDPYTRCRFGPGIYLAQTAAQAAARAEAEDGPRSGPAARALWPHGQPPGGEGEVGYLLLCRVAMGAVVRTRDEHPLPPGVAAAAAAAREGHHHRPQPGSQLQHEQHHHRQDQRQPPAPPRDLDRHGPVYGPNLVGVRALATVPLPGTSPSDPEAAAGVRYHSLLGEPPGDCEGASASSSSAAVAGHAGPALSSQCQPPDCPLLVLFSPERGYAEYLVAYRKVCVSSRQPGLGEEDGGALPWQ